MRGLAGRLAVGAILAVLVFSALAAAETRILGNIQLSVSAKLSPKHLPRDELSPVAVSVGWKIASTNESSPPVLEKVKLAINRHGIFDVVGLPYCPYGKIQPASTERALANCRSAVVGRGSFSALVGLENQDSYISKGKMVVFNGTRGRTPVLFGHIYTETPFAASFVIIFKVEKSKRGAYGTTLTAKMPANLRKWGNLTEVNMRLSRTFGYGGKKRSFISAGCPAPKGLSLAVFNLARTTFSFAGGNNISSTLTESCKVRR
jgi:hypothetical protein